MVTMMLLRSFHHPLKVSWTGQSDPPFLHRLDLILLTADDDVDENALFRSEAGVHFSLDVLPC